MTRAILSERKMTTYGNRTAITILMKSATFVQLPLWLQSFESMTYAVAERHLVIAVALIVLTVSVILLSVLHYKAAGGWGRKALWVLFAVVLVNVLLGFVVDGISRYDGAGFGPEETTDLAFRVRREQPLPDAYELLGRDEYNRIYIVGKQRSALKRYLGVAKSLYSHDGEEHLARLIPADFTQYAALVEERSPGDRGREPIDDGMARFLSWQFPDYVFLLVRIDERPEWTEPEVQVISFEETYAMGHQGIYPVEPLLTELRRGRFGSRLRSYWNVLRFTWRSPHHRGDLVDDPYFLVWRGRMDEAREGLRALPQSRRAFIEAMLRDVQEGNR